MIPLQDVASDIDRGQQSPHPVPIHIQLWGPHHRHRRPHPWDGRRSEPACIRHLYHCHLALVLHRTGGIRHGLPTAYIRPCTLYRQSNGRRFRPCHIHRSAIAHLALIGSAEIISFEKPVQALGDPDVNDAHAHAKPGRRGRGEPVCAHVASEGRRTVGRGRRYIEGRAWSWAALALDACQRYNGRQG